MGEAFRLHRRGGAIVVQGMGLDHGGAALPRQVDEIRQGAEMDVGRVPPGIIQRRGCAACARRSAATAALSNSRNWAAKSPRAGRCAADAPSPLAAFRWPGWSGTGSRRRTPGRDSPPGRCRHRPAPPPGPAPHRHSHWPGKSRCRGHPHSWPCRCSSRAPSPQPTSSTRAPGRIIAAMAARSGRKADALMPHFPMTSPAPRD